MRDLRYTFSAPKRYTLRWMREAQPTMSKASILTPSCSPRALPLSGSFWREPRPLSRHFLRPNPPHHNHHRPPPASTDATRPRRPLHHRRPPRHSKGEIVKEVGNYPSEMIPLFPFSRSRVPKLFPFAVHFDLKLRADFSNLSLPSAVRAADPAPPATRVAPRLPARTTTTGGFPSARPLLLPPTSPSSLRRPRRES